MNVTAVIVAAGLGSRMGAEKNKVLLPLANCLVIEHTLRVFSSCGLIDGIVLVTRECDIAECGDLIKNMDKPVKIIKGGDTRQQSVFLGLSNTAGADFAVIHDGARALITEDLIEKTLENAVKYGASAAGVICKDTLKSADSDGFITATLDRESTYLIQTPQIFAYNEILSAHRLAEKDHFTATDDCALYEKYIGKVKITQGSYENIKLTTPEDMLIAERILKGREKR